MTVRNVSNMEYLREQVDTIIEKYGRNKAASYSVKNSVLFRGQPNGDWDLNSTLERASKKKKWTLQRYFDLTSRIRPIIESYYPLPFSQPSNLEVDKWLREVALSYGVVNVPGYDYLLYLRHYGFPSPLVDWTTSLYIAAGFAFFQENAATDRAIYMFVEAPEGLKGTTVGDPEIAQLGPYVKTHKRHFLQQANYTICFRRAEGIPLEKYEKVISDSEARKQDLLWKFIIPSSERENVLRFLASVNINPFSLMPSEENLLTTLWLNEVTLPDYDWAQHNKEITD
jgi:hypothetical protein